MTGQKSRVYVLCLGSRVLRFGPCLNSWDPRASDALLICMVLKVGREDTCTRRLAAWSGVP